MKLLLLKREEMLSLMKNCLFVQGLEGAGSEEQEEGVRLEMKCKKTLKQEEDVRLEKIKQKTQKDIKQQTTHTKITTNSQRPGRYHNEEDGP